MKSGISGVLGLALKLERPLQWKAWGGWNCQGKIGGWWVYCKEPGFISGSLFSSSPAEPKPFFFFFNMVVCFGLPLPEVSVSVRPVC